MSISEARGSVTLSKRISLRIPPLSYGIRLLLLVCNRVLAVFDLSCGCHQLFMIRRVVVTLKGVLTHLVLVEISRLRLGRRRGNDDDRA